MKIATIVFLVMMCALPSAAENKAATKQMFGKQYECFPRVYVEHSLNEEGKIKTFAAAGMNGNNTVTPIQIWTNVRGEFTIVELNPTGQIACVTANGINFKQLRRQTTGKFKL